jgi:hypothetical protein
MAGHSKHREGVLQHLFRMLATRANRPRKRLGVAGSTTCNVDLRDNLFALRILSTYDVDSCEQGRDHHEQARVGDVTTRAYAATEAKGGGTGIADGGVERAVGGEVTLRVESLGIRIIFRVMQDGPV